MVCVAATANPFSPGAAVAPQDRSHSFSPALSALVLQLLPSWQSFTPRNCPQCITWSHCSHPSSLTWPVQAQLRTAHLKPKNIHERPVETVTGEIMRGRSKSCPRPVIEDPGGCGVVTHRLCVEREQREELCCRSIRLQVQGGSRNAATEGRF